MDEKVLDIPFYQSDVPAGFPSPAEDFMDLDLNLQEYLVQHKRSKIKPFAMQYLIGAIEAKNKITSEISSGSAMRPRGTVSLSSFIAFSGSRPRIEKPERIIAVFTSFGQTAFTRMF